MSTEPTLEQGKQIAAALRAFTDAAVAEASKKTEGGKRIDDHQVHAERIAQLATELRAVEEFLAYAERVAGEASADPLIDSMVIAFAGEIAAKSLASASAALDDYGISEDALGKTLGAADVQKLVRAAMHESRFREIGRKVAEQGGENNIWLGDDILNATRDSVRNFARNEVAPGAEKLHRNDDLVTDELISKMAEQGYFGLSIPEAWGGSEFGNQAMIITTEELSAASLAGAGSLITRPEILAKALLQGGTEDQKKKWLPPIASGELMVAVAVTEPNIGSDVAGVACSAERGAQDGVDGWFITGPKAWCTFAGRANVLALLVRTDPDRKLGAKGLSLLIVPKDPFTGHSFEMKQPGGGSMVGKADATPGYRGMHSYTLQLDRYFVPAENLVGEQAGEGKGFYLQMAGFAAGRLQTGGRACGVMQAALQTTAAYVTSRAQFGKPLIDYQLTQYKLGRMATHLNAARQITYAAARVMDEKGGEAALEPAQAKLFASDTAVWTSQEGQLLHGGWGYAEEYAISRYVVDAQVLPIFEGVKPILELKVIARNLLR
ncbi:MAG: acyl-CoA dehydrogenase family protein [Deltaproteobacteria bacterium]|nr:acyl-CoA dehydrogenase family protein [Deltaproteobacteria bacterium]